MTEDEARDLLRSRVSRETEDQLATLVALLIAENEAQNLIARSTIETIWSRHILDSAQLVWLADRSGLWLDIGSGGGLPGLVVAVMRAEPIVLVEPRAKRADFLQRAVEQLGVAIHAQVAASRVETAALPAPAAIISARAVAALPALFAMAAPLAVPDALWLLPKGRSGEREVAEARQEWQGEFETRASLSDPGSQIVVARHVRRKHRR